MKVIADTLGGQLIILVALYILVFGIVMLDLWAGIRKAKKRGEFRSSYGLRQTVEKLAKYYNMLLVLTVIDVMQMLSISHINPQINRIIPLIPFLTILGGLFIGIIELKSIYENAEDKDKGKYQDAARLVKEVIKNKEAINIIKYLKENKDEL